jgi:UDP-glucose 4-epimerase
MTPGRVLVTGGAGFIGSHVVDRLVERGYRVTVLDDLSSGTLEWLPPGVDFVRADVTSPSVCDAIREIDPEFVFHAAAQTSVPASMAWPVRDRDVNLAGTWHVIAGAKVAKARRLIFLSSGGAIYGEADGADELTLPAPRSYYAIHKYAAERYVELSGLDYAIARIANVYGPRQGAGEGGVVAAFIDRLRSSQPVTVFGSGDQRRDFVHVLDVVDALLAMMGTQLNGIWNVGTGISITINELLSELAAAFGLPANVRRAPARSGDVFISRLLIGRIGTELGWAPTRPLAVGLRDTLAWRP